MDLLRRQLLSELSAFTLSGTALSFAMGASKVEAARGYRSAEDVYFLNQALRKEYEVIMSYDYSMQTGLFEKVAFEMFNFIITNHNRHKEMIIKAIYKLGGKPISPPSNEEFRNSFNAELIRTGSDALRFNKRYESEAYVTLSEISTYLEDSKIKLMTAGFAADEMVHQSMIVRAKVSVPFDPTLRIRD